MADWDPHEESPAANGAWGKRDDIKDNHATPEVCWDHSGQVKPLALTDMSGEEKDVSGFFSSFSHLVLTPLFILAYTSPG